MKNRLKQSVLIAFLYLGIAMLSLNLTSCEEGGIDSQPATGLKVGVGAQSSYTVTALAPGDITFNITSNTPWTIHSNQDWCQVTPVSSTVSALVHDITVTTDVNMDNKPRTAVLTITGEGVADQTVTITQDAKLDFEVSMFEVSQLLDRAGEAREFRIASNKPWTLSSDKAWLTFDKTSGEGGEEVNVIQATAEVNNGNLRRATITVKSDVEEKTYVVTQDGNQLEVANQTDTIFDYVSETKNFQINSNLTWKAEVDSQYDWIHIVSGATGTGNGEISIKADPNPIFIARVGEVHLKPTVVVPGLEDVIIRVYQDVAFEFLTPDEITLNDNASVSVVPGASTNQIKTKKGYDLVGKSCIWKFSSLNIPEGGQLYLAGDASSNSKFWIKPTGVTFYSGGAWGWSWADPDFSLGGRNLSDLKEWKTDYVLVNDKVNVEVYFNGEKIFTRSGLNNPNDDLPIYMGCSGEGASFTLESFTVIPLE